jgi:hypothetical protein
MADDRIPALVLSSRFGGVGASFKRVVARLLRFLIAYDAHVHEWLHEKIAENERRTERLEAELAEMRLVLGQVRVAVPQALARVQDAVDRCTRQIEAADDRGVATELAGVRRALARLESKLQSERPQPDDPFEAPPPAAEAFAPASNGHREPATNGHRDPAAPSLFADAFRRPHQPGPAVGGTRASRTAIESNGTRHEA